MAKHFIVTSIKQTDRLASVIFSSSPKNLEFDVNFLKLRKSEFDWNYESKKLMHTHTRTPTRTHTHTCTLTPRHSHTPTHTPDLRKSTFLPSHTFSRFSRQFFQKIDTKFFFNVAAKKNFLEKRKHSLFCWEHFFFPFLPQKNQKSRQILVLRDLRSCSNPLIELSFEFELITWPPTFRAARMHHPYQHNSSKNISQAP